MAIKRKAATPLEQPESNSPKSEFEEEEAEAEGEEVDESESEEGSESEEESEEESEPEQEEENEDLSNRETLAKLIEPFSKDQLIQLLTESLPRHPTLLKGLSKSAESDRAHRDLFVYGLGWDCTTQTLSDAFQIYGPIESCKAILDHATNHCKGYGFVVFKTRRAANKALKEPQKPIGGRTAFCQLASKGNAANSGSKSSYKQPKVAGPGNGNAVAAPPQPMVMNVQPSGPLGLGYVAPQQPSMGLMIPGVNRSVVPSAYGGVSSVSPSAYGVSNVIPGVVGSYQSQSALQRMGVNSVTPSVIGSYQSQAALQGLAGYKSRSASEASKSGLPSFLGR